MTRLRWRTAERRLTGWGRTTGSYYGAPLAISFVPYLIGPIYEIEELEVHDLDFPDLVNEIADSDGNRQLME